MSEKTIIIIGAGIAGLAAGCYSRANGYRTLIFEMNNKPGGLCTAWRRKDYVFDGCIHHLAGASRASKYFSLWEELGTASLKMDFHDIFVSCEGPDGRAFNLFTDIGELAEHLLELVRLAMGLLPKTRNHALVRKIWPK